MNTAFDSISIKIASPDQIKDSAKQTSCKRRTPAEATDGTFICPEKGTCSCGEVKKAETINYRSFRPEPEGLFCEAIFGPQKDWECNCGKYKRIKHKGMICDRCGVEITQQRVRRDRLGYIQLAAPVSHIWYFKGLPSRIGVFCGLSSRDVERVLYFEGFIVVEVTDPDCPLEVGQVLTEVEYVEQSTKHWGGFRAGTGAEVIREILSDIDLEEKIEALTQELAETTSNQKKLKVAKQLKQMADFAEAEQRPEWMILDVIPVIPPDLRPLVPLEGGRFATSDLNDLYRRVINRNNRLRKLIQLRSPEVILRNEKRMLQEAVDAFFDNGRHGRRVTGPGNRPLKSLAEVLKGKIGRFRQNLLGKRVDYSGRSVIVVGPELGLHQCGIPKRMAVELFKPFIIERLQAYGYTQTIKRAKHIAEHVDSDSPVWEVVEEVIADHPVLLNRPPTLHRLGIQAFLPVLVEGKSIRIPPLVCKAFNADFDGDQMAVHVPLTVEAQAEAKLLMLSSHNILKPSHGSPIAVPELDMVLGPSFLTKTLTAHAEDAALLHEAYTAGDASAFEAFRDKPWYHRRFAHPEEVITAHAAGQLKLHDSVQLFCESDEGVKITEPILTTVGRVIFNEVLPSELVWEDEHSQQHIHFFNAEAGGRELSALIHRCFNELGTRVTTEVLENVQKLAFEYATLSGISPGITDYITPNSRNELVNTAKTEIENLLEGAPATESEESENEQIRIWLNAKDKIEAEMFETLPQIETALVERGDPRKVHPKVDPNGLEVDDKMVEGFSPVHVMADSGARARKDPFMQISAFIGLKAKQDGDILIPPIGTATSREGDSDLPNYFCSYREGLDVLDYFNSTYGSRKGLVDTALKTAHSGYLTRRLVDVAQDVRVTSEDCHTLNSIQKFATEGGDLAFKISGRTAAEDIVHPESGDVLVPANTVISIQSADQIDTLGVKVVNVRSVLTCQNSEGVCAKCYGNDLTTNNLVNVGEAVGIIAAQSIGEPGTQLTMRTFHTGGAVEDVSEARQHRILSKVSGTVRFRDFQPGRTVKQERDLWIATENRANLDGPAYKVQQVNHPGCQLREGELLSEKQYSENTERYKGFDTKTWLYEVTAVLDSDCRLKLGQQLSQTEYVKALAEYGFQRFVTPHYRVTQVQHPDVSAKAGDLLTEADVKQLKDEIRHGFDIELYYLDPDTGELVKEEDLKEASNASLGQTDATPDSEEDDTGFKRVYRVTDIDEKVQKNFPFKVGQEVPAEEITPWLTPFEIDSKPIYVVNKEISGGSSLLEQAVLPSDSAGTDASPLKAGAELGTTDYERACTAYRDNGWAFKVEKQEIERHRVTKVYHEECPLKPGEELTAEALSRAHRRFTGFDAQKLRHRVTQVYHPDCLLKPGDLLGESEAKRHHEAYLGFITSTSETTVGGFEAERVYRITAVNHPDCPLEVGELLTQHEATAKRRQYKGLEVARHYEVTNIEDGTTAATVGQRLTETEYRALRKTDTELAEKVVSRYHVVSVHHPELELEVGAELAEDDYRTYNRKFKGFDTELIYKIVEDKRDTETPLEPGTELLAKEYRALEKANKKVTHTVTAVYHPNCTYAVGDELPAEQYAEAKAKYRGFEVDELSLQMRIEVETTDGTRVPHVIPADYSFSLSEGDSIRQGETLAELHERTANLDIVAGIPRVTDLFEARRLKRGDAAQIAEIEGYVRSAGSKGGVPQYRIEHEGYVSRLYQIPDEKRRIAEGDWVDAGEPLTSGFLNPHDILSIGRTTIEGVPVEGEEAVWAYLVDEVQKVYGKGTINDKHVEAIVRQMLTKIRITEPGDTDFYPNDEVQRKRFERINSEIEAEGGTPATGEPILQSISKASLSTDSFISAASFQQTTKVLTDAAVSGQTDQLFGLKENVILGRLIPAGSGFSSFQNLEISAVEPEEAAEASDDD
ncbi:DNA-directed RNA polymerase subunit beta' [Candidatus Poribacteria bacterium]|nr:DNA-directed RNA polymerase subunit beta' [Candidatus Poribacteria bacterium]